MENEEEKKNWSKWRKSKRMEDGKEGDHQMKRRISIKKYILNPYLSDCTSFRSLVSHRHRHLCPNFNRKKERKTHTWHPNAIVVADNVDVCWITNAKPFYSMYHENKMKRWKYAIFFFSFSSISCGVVSIETCNFWGISECFSGEKKAKVNEDQKMENSFRRTKRK